MRKERIRKLDYGAIQTGNHDEKVLPLQHEREKEAKGAREQMERKHKRTREEKKQGGKERKKAKQGRKKRT